MLVTAPATIFLFVVLSGPLTSYPTHKILYETTDGVVCNAQAEKWNAKIAPLKPMYFCFEHAQTKLEVPGQND